MAITPESQLTSLQRFKLSLTRAIIGKSKTANYENGKIVITVIKPDQKAAFAAMNQKLQNKK